MLAVDEGVKSDKSPNFLQALGELTLTCYTLAAFEFCYSYLLGVYHNREKKDVFCHCMATRVFFFLDLDHDDVHINCVCFK